MMSLGLFFNCCLPGLFVGERGEVLLSRVLCHCQITRLPAVQYISACEGDIWLSISTTMFCQPQILLAIP